MGVPRGVRYNGAVIKKVLLTLALAFVAYYLVTEPVGAAGAVKGAVSAVGDAFTSIVAFLQRLFD